MNVDAQALGRAVVNERARAVRRSMAMMGMRRLCSWSSRVGCASARKLFFFPAQGGGGARKGGAGLRVELSF